MFDLDQITVAELKAGYRHDRPSGQYHCLFCQASFDEGLVYPSGDRFCTAGRAAADHVCQVHGSPFEQLLRLDKRFITLTDNQKALLRLIKAGESNQAIAARTGSAPSTIRAQRFLFREKARQAKLMLALMELLEEGASPEPAVPDTGAGSGSPVHLTAAQIDERFNITAKDKAQTIKSCVESLTPLVIRTLPVKEKRKLILLALIAEQFDPDRRYSEPEVNAILKPVIADYVTIRRYLIEYGYLDRTSSGSAYWVKNGGAGAVV